MKTIKEFKTSIVKGPLARNEKLQSTAWVFMADIVKRQLNENGIKQFRKVD
jgi:hypothetical protein